MKIEKVKKLSPKERLIYWIKERHAIYLRRKAGEGKPWTDDEVLQSIFFTNPYRENDKTTVWFKENIRDPLKNEPEVLMATIIFRWFNKPDPTGIILSNSKTGLMGSLVCKWNESVAIRRIEKAWKENGPVFTGAYMIKAGNGPPGCKIPNVCKAITNIWKERKRLVGLCKKDCRLEALHSELVKFPHLGGFMAYEIVCDLRYTKLLRNASDILTWSNLGPGAARGLQRLRGIPIKVPRTGMKDARPKPPKDWLEIFQTLRMKVNETLPENVKLFELREIEHSLCEYDKYERILFGQGRSKRKYNGVS